MNQSINWKTAARLAGAAGLLMAGAWSLAGRAAEPAAPAAAPAVAPAVKLPDAAGRLIVFSSDFDLTALKPSAVEVALGGTAEAPALRITAKAQGNWPGVGLARMRLPLTATLVPGPAHAGMRRWTGKALGALAETLIWVVGWCG